MKNNRLKTLLNKSILGSALAVTLISAPLQLQAASHVNESNAIIRYNTIHHPVIGEGGMVSSQRMLASQVGAEILRQGGNAIDAAVATGIALAVTLPRAGNLGGGGFMLVYLAEQDKTVAIDYREMAPAAAHRDIFLDKNGDVDNQKARFSHASSGVPGTVAGLVSRAKKIWHHELARRGKTVN